MKNNDSSSNATNRLPITDKGKVNTVFNIDDDMYSELKRRSKSFKNSNAKTYTWEETKANAIERVEGKRQ